MRLNRRYLWITVGAVVGTGVGLSLSVGAQSLASIVGTGALASQPGYMVEGAVTAVSTIPSGPRVGLASESGLVALGDAIIANQNAVGAKEATGKAQLLKGIQSVNAAGKQVDGGIAEKVFDNTRLAEIRSDLTAPGSHTVNACGNTLAATASASITNSRSSVSGALSGGVIRAMGSSPTLVASRARGATLTRAEINASALFPTGQQRDDVGNGHGDVASPQAAKNTQAYEMSLIDPNPVPRLPASLHARIKQGNPATLSPPLMQYESEKNVWDSRMGLAVEALSDVASYYSPLSPQNAWTRASYASVGETPPSTSVSEMAMLDLQVKSRIDSPNWYTHIEGDNETGLLREIALMQASILDIELRRLKTAQLGLSLAASQYANQVNRTERQKYMAAYNAVVTSEGDRQ